MQCTKCEEQLEEISTDHGQPPVTLFPSKEQAHLYVCTSRDCANVGKVLCIPTEPKEA